MEADARYNKADSDRDKDEGDGRVTGPDAAGAATGAREAAEGTVIKRRSNGGSIDKKCQEFRVQQVMVWG